MIIKWTLICSKYEHHQINWANPYDVNLDISIVGLLQNRLAIPYPTPTYMQ